MGQDERVGVPLVHSGEWNIHYDYAVGETATRFFLRLRDEGKIAGKRCPGCQAVLVPPRAYCERCFVKTEEWVDVGPEGTIEAFTIVYEPFDGLPAAAVRSSLRNPRWRHNSYGQLREGIGSGGASCCCAATRGGKASRSGL
jgi:hypothetical protein